MSVDYKKLKNKWKEQGEIPSWYSTNALQFFMDKYSYQGESVKSRYETVNKMLATLHLKYTRYGGMKMNILKDWLMNKHLIN